jgi:uncharacterized protein (TIGR02246 family)
MRIMVILLSALAYLTGPCMRQTLSPSPHNAIATGIEKLHQADVAATLARDVETLTALWDADAVLLQPGQPAIAGKSAFREFIKQSFAKSPSGKVLKYVPDIRDVQVAGDVAYEWGYFDSTFRPSDQEQTVSFRAKFVRVLKQQPDGNRRFTRVIWTPE